MLELGSFFRKILRKPLTLSNDETLIEIETLIFQDKLENALDKLEEYGNENYQSSIEAEQFFKKHFGNFLKSRVYVDMGKPNDGLELLEGIMEEIENSKNPVLINLSKIEYGNALLKAGKIKESWDVLDQAEQEVNGLKFFYKDDYYLNQARVNNLQSKLYRRKADFSEAIREQNESIELYEKLGKRYHTAEPLNDLGISYASIGDMDNALKYLGLSSRIYEELNNESQLLKIYNNTGMIEWQTGKTNDALNNFQKGLKLSQEKNIKPASAMVLLNIGLVYLDQGQVSQSQDNFMESMKLFEELDNKPNIAKCQLNLGNTFHLIGELDKALEFLEQSLAIFEDIDDKNEVAKILGNMGSIYLEKRNDTKAVELLTRSIDLHETSGNYLDLTQPLSVLIEANIGLDRIDEAEVILAKFETVKNKLEDNKNVDQLFKLSKAKILIESDRVVKRAEAQKIFTEIADDEIVSQQNTTTAMLRLGDLLLQELKVSASEGALNEFKELIDRLDKVARSQAAGSVQQTPTIIEVLTLQSKLALIDLDVKKSQELLDEAYELANTNGLNQLASMIDVERDTYKKEMMKYKKMVETNASLYERLQQSQIENYLKRAESILKR